MGRRKIEKKRGRGRPRKDRHLEDFEGAGVPPRDVLAIGHWLQRIVAITAHQARVGHGNKKVRAGIRSSCAAAARLLPSALTARAMGLGELGSIDPAGPPPADPLQVSDWFLLNLVDDVYLQIIGEADEAVSAEWRSASRAAVKVWPPDLMVEARRILREELGDPPAAGGQGADEFDEVEADGPERPGVAQSALEWLPWMN